MRASLRSNCSPETERLRLSLAKESEVDGLFRDGATVRLGASSRRPTCESPRGRAARPGPLGLGPYGGGSRSGHPNQVDVDEAADLGAVEEPGHSVVGLVLPDGAGRASRRSSLIGGHAEFEAVTSHDCLQMGYDGARFNDGIGAPAQGWTPTGYLPESSGRVGQGRDGAAPERHGTVDTLCHEGFNRRENRRTRSQDDEGTTATTASWDLGESIALRRRYSTHLGNRSKKITQLARRGRA